jgi:hypothetical protein
VLALWRRSLLSAAENVLTIVRSPKGLAFKHFILTRFWFATGPSGANALGPDVHRWLEDRLKLFNSYCLPSVVGQSSQDFRWLIYFDALAPGDFIERMRGLAAPWANIEVLARNEWYVPGRVSPWKDRPPKKSEIVNDIVDRVAGETDWVLTTRFDSDDGLHRDFVKRLHEAVDDPMREFLNFPNGILFHNGKSYLYRHLSNAFISLLEPVGTIKTVLCAPHSRVNEVGPIRQLSPAPAFLQVVHASNDSNKPRGYRVQKILALQGFEGVRTLFAPPLEESNAEIWLSNAFWGSLWFGRDRLAKPMKMVRAFLQRRGLIRTV